MVAERLLSISGEDLQTIDRKFREQWTGRLAVRFLILTNELPQIADASSALPSRFIILATSKSWLGREDERLTDRLLRELPGIFNWALAGLARLMTRRHFVQPESGLELAKDMAALSSPVLLFLKDIYVRDPAGEVECGSMFSAWKAWCELQNRDHPGTRQKFGAALRAAVPGLKIVQPRTGKLRERRYAGFRLRLPTDPD